MYIPLIQQIGQETSCLYHLVSVLSSQSTVNHRHHNNHFHTRNNILKGRKKRDKWATEATGQWYDSSTNHTPLWFCRVKPTPFLICFLFGMNKSEQTVFFMPDLFQQSWRPWLLSHKCKQEHPHCCIKSGRGQTQLKVKSIFLNFVTSFYLLIKAFVIIIH